MLTCSRPHLKDTLNNVAYILGTSPQNGGVGTTAHWLINDLPVNPITRMLECPLVHAFLKPPVFCSKDLVELELRQIHERRSMA